MCIRDSTGPINGNTTNTRCEPAAYIIFNLVSVSVQYSLLIYSHFTAIFDYHKQDYFVVDNASDYRENFILKLFV